jgi:hypothetical protein
MTKKKIFPQGGGLVREAWDGKKISYGNEK